MEKYTFFNSVDHDRKHYAEDFARHLAKYFTNGIFNNECMVLGNNNDMSVNVSIGSANINGYRYDNDSNKRLEIENADGVLSRIDNVVIRWDLTNRTITAQIIKGSYSDNPIAPALERNSTIYDLRIAKINVSAGITTITQDLVTDTRFINSDCGNVVCAVQTPDTEQLFIQIQAEFEKQLKSFENILDKHNGDFTGWFNTIKNKLDGDVAGNLANDITKIVNASPKSYLLTLNVENWTLNENTDFYEYDVARDGVTSQTEVKVILDIVNQDRLNKAYTKSYNGGFKVISNILPKEDIDATIIYELTNLEVN